MGVEAGRHNTEQSGELAAREPALPSTCLLFSLPGVFFKNRFICQPLRIKTFHRKTQYGFHHSTGHLLAREQCWRGRQHLSRLSNSCLRAGGWICLLATLPL